jgi:hypothetical protein
MRWPLLALLLLAVPVSADQVPCRDETRKIAALKDRIASLERTLEAERFDKIDLNYKVILTSLALNKSEAVVASLRVENARLKAVPVPARLPTSISVTSSAKIIPPSSKPPKLKRSSTVSKRSKSKPIAHNVTVRDHEGLVKKFWP